VHGEEDQDSTYWPPHTGRTSVIGSEKIIEERRIWWRKLIYKGREQRKEEEKDE
jgi:hypothetical protein